MKKTTRQAAALLCEKHLTALRRYNSARLTWRIMRKDPEPADKKARILGKLTAQVNKCKVCHDLNATRRMT